MGTHVCANICVPDVHDRFFLSLTLLILEPGSLTEPGAWLLLDWLAEDPLLLVSLALGSQACTSVWLLRELW